MAAIRYINKIRSLRLFCRYITPLLIVLAASVASAEIVDRIVAVVNDEIITYSMLNEEFAPYEKQIRAQNYPFAKEMEIRFRFRENLIERLVDQKLTEQEVKRLGITIADKEVDEAIERTKSMNSLTDEMLRTELKKNGMTMARYKQEMRQQLLKTRLIQYEVKSKIVITAEEIKEYYDRNKAELGNKPFEESKKKISDMLYQKQVDKMFKNWISDLRENAHIKIIQ